MGADIYLNSQFLPNREKYEPAFQAAVTKRNKAPQGSTAAEVWQGKVDEYYDAMYSQGYFRDSYNPSSLFWLLELSWWKLAEELCDDDGLLPVEAAQRLHAMLEARPVTKQKIAAWWSEHGKGADGTRESWEEYFQSKRSELMALLRQSIELQEPLSWSV